MRVPSGIKLHNWKTKTALYLIHEVWDHPEEVILMYGEGIVRYQ